VTAALRTTDKELVACMQPRAKEAATDSECAKADNKALWDYIVSLAKAMKQ
jgi:hypothetical protein